MSIYHVALRTKEKLSFLEAFDMNLPSVLTKMMWILSLTNDANKIKELFYTTMTKSLLRSKNANRARPPGFAKQIEPLDYQRAIGGHINMKTILFCHNKQFRQLRMQERFAQNVQIYIVCIGTNRKKYRRKNFRRHIRFFTSRFKAERTIKITTIRNLDINLFKSHAKCFLLTTLMDCTPKYQYCKLSSRTLHIGIYNQP